MFVILLATYNGEKYIEEQLQSIVAQSLDDWFLLVCDDGSSDSTIKLVEKYVASYPSKVKLITNTSNNHGAKNNFFYLLENAPQGDYYVFCDQDDVWSNDKLQTLLDEYKKHDSLTPTLVYHDLKIVDQDLNVLSQSFGDYTDLRLNLNEPIYDLIKYNYIPGCAMSFNHALKSIIKFGGARINIHDWWVILICASFGKIYSVERSLTLYRQHTSNTIGIMPKAHGFGLIKRYLSVEKFKKVFAMLRKAKRDSYNILEELKLAYGDSLDVNTVKLIEDNMRYMSSKNKLSALIWGMKKQNRQSGLLKNIYYWTSKLR